MPFNSDKPRLWKTGVVQSVDLYYNWFITLATGAYRMARAQAIIDVEEALKLAGNLMINSHRLLLLAYFPTPKIQTTRSDNAMQLLTDQLREQVPKLYSQGYNGLVDVGYYQHL